MKDLHLTFEEQQELVLLKDVPGYRILMKIMDVLETDILEDMEHETNAAELHRKTRVWQMWRKLSQALRVAPESVLTEHQRLREESPEDFAYLDPLFRGFQPFPPRVQDTIEEEEE